MLQFEESGRGPAILMMHGTPSPSMDFAPIAAALAATHRVLIVDLPGYRGTAKVAGPDSFRRTQALLEESLLSRGVGELAVVGFSGGALRAFGLACSSRVNVTAIVSLAGHAGIDDPVRAAFRQTAAAVRGGLVPRGALSALFLSPAFIARQPESAGRVDAWVDLISADDLADELESLADAPDYRPKLPSFTKPVLAMSGALDGTVPSSVSAAMHALNPLVEVDLVPHVGHALLVECPDRVLDAVRRTLGRA